MYELFLFCVDYIVFFIACSLASSFLVSCSVRMVYGRHLPFQRKTEVPGDSHHWCLKMDYGRPWSAQVLGQVDGVAEVQDAAQDVGPAGLEAPGGSV